MSAGVTLLFTADTHVGDHRTINLHRRPFDVDVDERGFAPMALFTLLGVDSG